MRGDSMNRAGGSNRALLFSATDADSAGESPTVNDIPLRYLEAEHSGHSSGVFGAFFEHARTPLLIIDESSQIVEVNEAASAMLGIRRGAGSDLLAAFWHVSRTSVLRMLEGVKREIPVSPVVARTAQDQLVEVDAFVIDDEEPRLIGVMITDRSTIDDAQRRLKDQEERYRSLFEWAPVALREEDFSAVGSWLDRLRAEGVVDLVDYMQEHPGDVERAIKSVRTTRANAATVEMLEAPSVLSILRGYRTSDLTPQLRGSFMEQFHALWEGRTDYEADFVGVNYAGQPFECRVRWIVPRTSTGPDFSRVAVSLVDMTQLKATQRRLERMVADKDRFVASVSHELRTPLSAVFGISEELNSNWASFSEAEVRDLIAVVAGQSADLSLLVEDLLVAANLEAGRVTINPEVIDLGSVVREAYADCVRSAPDTPDVDMTRSLISAFADPARVRQIVRNLITNAVRYGGDSLFIECDIDKRPYVSIIDNGAGVPLEQRESIFVPYFQVVGSSSVPGSLGLGLAISRELARRMDGELSYEYRDGMSVFTLELPPV
jgi:signal transduction histidine kinase